MADIPKQPRNFDAVLGGESQIPVGAAILGGLEGVKQRFANAVNEHQKAAALKDAANYGRVGLEFLLQSLNSETQQVQKNLYLLLRHREESVVKQLLQNHHFWLLFECLTTLNSHSGYVLAVATSPDGKTAVSGSNDGTFKVWDLQARKLVATLKKPSGAAVKCAAIAPSCQMVATGNRDQTILVRNLQTGRELYAFTENSETIFALVFSPDGQHLASSSGDKTIKIWNLKTGECSWILEGHLDVVYSMAITPDGQYLVSGSKDKSIKIWNLKTGQEIRTLKGHSNIVFAVAVSPDGQMIASGSSDETLKVWNFKTGKEIHTLNGHLFWVKSAVFGACGQILISGSLDETIKVWNVKSGKLLTTLKGHLSPVECVAITPNGQTLISGSWDKTVKIWGIQ